MSKYFNVELKPTIAASKQHAGTFTAGMVIFDWQPIQVPRGTVCLTDLTVMVRAKGDATPTNNDLGCNFVFSKTNTVSLGTVRAALDHRPSDDFLGIVELIAGNFGAAAFQSTTIATTSNNSTGGAAHPPITMTPDVTTGDNVGYDTIYVGMVAAGTFDFQSINTVNETGFDAAAQTVITMDDGSGGTTMDCREHFAAGDVLHAQDDAVLGTLASAAAQAITLTAANTAAIAENDVIYNINPVKLILGFER